MVNGLAQNFSGFSSTYTMYIKTPTAMMNNVVMDQFLYILKKIYGSEEQCKAGRTGQY